MSVDPASSIPLYHVPAQQWRLLLPFLLMALTAAAYLWQRHEGVDTRSLETALSRQAEIVARMDAVAQRALNGERAAFVSLRRLRTLAATGQSDISAVFLSFDKLSSEPGIGSALDDIAAAWRSLRQATDRLLELETATTTLRADVEAFQSIATGILVTTDEMVDALVAAEESPAQVRTAARQLLLIQRISANVRRVLEGGDGVITAADRLGRDAVLFGEVNIALLNGNTRMNIKRTRAPAARETLVDIGREFRRGTELIEQIMAHAVAMVEIQDAAADIGERSMQVISHMVTLQRRTARLTPEETTGALLIESFGLLALFSLLVVMIHIAAVTRRARRAARVRSADAAQRDAERSEREAQLELREQSTEVAVRRLIGDLDRLVRGEAPPDPENREPIFDTAVAPLEVAINSLRHRLRTLTQSANKLVNSSIGFNRTARSAQFVAADLSKQVEQAASATKRMAAHVESVGEHLRKAERVGTETKSLVSRTQPSLQMAESQSFATFAAAKTAAARVRQLNESTRKIEEVGRLIDEISEQCRMLSLNVSIRASLTEGSVNPAAASLAEEIKKLADNSRRAMRRINSINEDVRSHAGQAADGVKQVLWSAEKAVAHNKDAGKEISSAVVLAQRLETLNRQLVEALQEHTKLMIDVVKSTTSVHGIASRARQEFQEVAANASRLSELGALLETTVSGFDHAQDNQHSVIELQPLRPVEPAVPVDDVPTNVAKEAFGKD